MECSYVTSKFAPFSAEKRRTVMAALGGVIYCPVHRAIHTIKEDEANEKHQ